MAGLIYDERSLADKQLRQYDKFIHSRLNKYNSSGRTLVTYYNINTENTTSSLGYETNYQILGPESPLRYTKISDMFLTLINQLNPEDTNASQTQVRDISVIGEATVLPNTIMPREHDLFIIDHYHMNHIFIVTNVSQPGLTTDGSFKIQFKMLSTNPEEIKYADIQTVNEYKLDLQTVGGEDLTPVISKNDYEMRNRLIYMINDMIENYNARYYDYNHNCYLLHLNYQTLFDPSANMFMARNGTMIIDGAISNITLTDNKLRSPEMNQSYERSPFKWLERHAPVRYVDTFKYRTEKASNFIDSSFALYEEDVDIMLYGDAFCSSKTCNYFFPIEVAKIFEYENDIRCVESQCETCKLADTCDKSLKLKRYDYVSIIHDYIHGKMTDMSKLSLLTGDQLFDNHPSRDLYLWTPIIIHILKETLKTL